MLPTRHLPEFLLTVYVLILIPGPSVLFVISRGVALGRRAALATVLGNATGFALQLALVSVGVGAIVARSDAVFTVLKLCGATDGSTSEGVFAFTSCNLRMSIGITSWFAVATSRLQPCLGRLRGCPELDEQSLEIFDHIAPGGA